MTECRAFPSISACVQTTSASLVAPELDWVWRCVYGVVLLRYPRTSVYGCFTLADPPDRVVLWRDKKLDQLTLNRVHSDP